MKHKKSIPRIYRGIKGSYYIPDKNIELWNELTDYIFSMVPASMTRAASRSFTAQFLVFWDLYGEQIKRSLKKIGNS